jgi:hypothetical protein
LNTEGEDDVADLAGLYQVDHTSTPEQETEATVGTTSHPLAADDNDEGVVWQWQPYRAGIRAARESSVNSRVSSTRLV